MGLKPAEAAQLCHNICNGHLEYKGLMLTLHILFAFSVPFTIFGGTLEQLLQLLYQHYVKDTVHKTLVIFEFCCLYCDAWSGCSRVCCAYSVV